jgi:hypothetical protein
MYNGAHLEQGKMQRDSNLTVTEVMIKAVIQKLTCLKFRNARMNRNVFVIEA